VEIEKIKSVIESILFAAGRIVTINELMLVLEINKEEIENVISEMQEEYKNRGIQIIKVEDGYQMCSNKDFYEYIYPIIDKRNKPNLSNAALEVLAIIAYNTRITRAEIEAIRGVSSDASMYKLLELGLIEEAGKLDAPGKPLTFKTTNEFLKMFGYESLKSLPELPRYKLDENRQIVIDELIEKNSEETVNQEEVSNMQNEEKLNQEEAEEKMQENLNEAPMPEREDEENKTE